MEENKYRLLIVILLALILIVTVADLALELKGGRDFDRSGGARQQFQQGGPRRGGAFGPGRGNPQDGNQGDSSFVVPEGQAALF